MRYLLGERLYREALLARPKVRATNVLTFNIPMGYINSSTLSWHEKLYENTYNITIETSLDNGETWRPQLSGEQIPGLVETSITTPTKILIRATIDTTNTINPADITDITLYIDYSSIGHYAICSDGRAYLNGQEISGEPDFINLSDGTLKIKGGRKVDELYVTPRLLTKEEIDILHQTQYELQDPREGIDAGFRKISHISGEIDADGHTIYANIHGENKIVSHYGIDTATGDRGLFVYDIDEQGNPVEVGFTGRRGDGTVVGFGGEGFKEYLDVAKPPIAIKKGDIYFPFENSLYSTQGVKPLPGSVATLLPEGGVAVAEGTENLVTNPTEWRLYSNEYQVVEDTGETYLGCKISKTTKLTSSTPANELCTISIAKGETYTASIYQKCLYNAGDGFAGRLVFYYAGTLSTLASAEAEKIGEWERLKVTYANNTGTTLNNVRVYYYPAKTQGSITLTAAPQVEKKPFATPFVDGTRERGRLMYPGVIPSNEGTLLIWAKKNTLEPNTGDGYRKILDAQSPRIDFQWHQSGNLSANFGGANLNIPDPAQDLDWHQYTITYSGRTVKMYFDGQLVASGQAQEDLVNFSELCVGARWDGSGAGNALYDELLILPYAASPETVAAWHSLDASFYDFSDHMIVFDKEEGVFKVGMDGNLETIATQNYVQSQLENFEPDVKDADTLDGYHAIEILKMMYPIGSIYFNANSSANPASLFGFGTWERFGKGRVLVGVDESQTEFSTLGKTGGAKTHKLTINEMPSHGHGYKMGSGRLGYTGVDYSKSTCGYTSGTTDSTGGGQPHNNLQPYITVYMWRRIA